MSSGMNVEQAKELARKRNYKWAVDNLKGAYGISYKKATKILLYELAEIADRLVLCKDCKHRKEEDFGVGVYQWCELLQREIEIDWYCASGERIESE